MFWFPPEHQIERALLLVSIDREDIEDCKIASSVQQVSPIEERVIHKYGHDVRYFCRVAYEYHPHSL